MATISGLRNSVANKSLEFAVHAHTGNPACPNCRRNSPSGRVQCGTATPRSARAEHRHRLGACRPGLEPLRRMFVQQQTGADPRIDRFRPGDHSRLERADDVGVERPRAVGRAQHGLLEERLPRLHPARQRRDAGSGRTTRPACAILGAARNASLGREYRLVGRHFRSRLLFNSASIPAMSFP